MATKILVVDDDSGIRELLRLLLTYRGYEVLLEDTGVKGIARFRQANPDVTILDLHLPDMRGIEVLQQMYALDPEAIIVVLTGADIEVVNSKLLGLGATAVLQKGSSLRSVEDIMSRVLGRHHGGEELVVSC